jgi:hypothetical protein
MATELTDDDIRTEWLQPKASTQTDDDATDPGEGADDDATDADQDTTDPGTEDADGTDA